MSGRSRRNRGSSRTSSASSTGGSTSVQGSSNAQANEELANAAVEDDDKGILESIGSWFGDTASAAWDWTTDTAEEAWDTTTDYADVADAARQLILADEDGVRRATVDAGAAMTVLEDVGPMIPGVDLSGLVQFLGGFEFDEDQALGIALDVDAGTVELSAADLSIGAVNHDVFSSGPIRVRDVSIGGNVLASGATTNFGMRAGGVTAEDFRFESPAGPIRADAVEFTAFSLTGTSSNLGDMFGEETQTQMSFSVGSATMRGLDVLGATADSFTAADLGGQISTEEDALGFSAGELSASGLASEAASADSATVRGLSSTVDFSDPEAVQTEIRTEAAELRNLAGFGTTVASASLEGGQMGVGPDGVSASADVARMVGIQNGDVEVGGIAVTNGRVASNVDGSTTAGADHIRVDDASKGDQVSLDVGQVSGLSTVHRDGQTTANARGATLDGLSIRQGDFAADIADLGGSNLQMTASNDGFSSTAEELSANGITSGDASVSSIVLANGMLSSDAQTTRSAAGSITLTDAALGERASLSSAQLQGLTTESRDGATTGRFDSGSLTGVRGQQDDLSATVDRVDVMGGHFGQSADRLTAGAENVDLTRLGVRGDGVSADVNMLGADGLGFTAQNGGVTTSADRMYANGTTFDVQPGTGRNEGGNQVDVARAVETAGGLVDSVQGRVTADMVAGEYGPVRVKRGTTATTDINVRDGEFREGTSVDFSRDLASPVLTDVSGLNVTSDGKLEGDVGLPILGPLFNLEMDYGLTDQINEAMGRQGDTVASVDEIARFAAGEIRKGSASEGGDSPIDLASVDADLDVQLRAGTIDTGISQVTLQDGEGANQLNVQTNGVDQVVTSFARFLASSLFIDLGGQSLEAGRSTVEGAEVGVGQQGAGRVTGSVTGVTLQDVRVQG